MPISHTISHNISFAGIVTRGLSTEVCFDISWDWKSCDTFVNQASYVVRNTVKRLLSFQRHPCNGEHFFPSVLECFLKDVLTDNTQVL